MKKFREILAEVFDGLTTPQNTPKNAQKRVEKFPNHTTAIKVFIFDWERLESNLSLSKWICR